ncbi:GntR family transcriptional regulator [Pikeienuella piscinae]|uniref:GntR family transcriptional regulator n=1 Tax=Pikeienuella piscinae TaxID=2748098 RepID=A0A7L5C043_9RHOB|nr:GntR family transcriptional regulator [Pikeienuella piscinae]QIE56127.1 GntR family transcriptional regulator [Pikeienuella piscinae]
MSSEIDEGGHSEAMGVYARLREVLVAGGVAPGEKLMPRSLAPRYAASAATVREALLRLAAEGFVDSAPQRGFRAVKPSAGTVWEIAHFRVLLEAEGARLSIERGGMEWEANLTAAHHRLSHLEARMRGEAIDPALLRFWSGCDRAFHEALIAECGSRRLIAEHRTVFDQFKQHVVARDPLLGFRGPDLVREHSDILRSALDRDPVGCADALRRHFEAFRRSGVAQAEI